MVHHAIRTFVLLTAVLFSIRVSALQADPPAPPAQPWFPKAPPLSQPAGDSIQVDNVDSLYKAAKAAQPGQTLLLADGTYFLSHVLQIRTDRVTLRGKSGRRDAVVLDCSRSQDHEGIYIAACNGVTIADLTLANVRQNGYKINSDTGVNNVTLYNCVGHNIWQRQVKGVPGPLVDGARAGSKDCRIRYCLFYNDRAKRLDDEPFERANPDQFHGDYIGGIDSMNIRHWEITDNVFVGIHGKNSAARGAIFLWNDSRDAVVERNIIIDCDSGICLGNSFRAEQWKDFAHCSGFLVANNFVTRCPENNILADHTKDCRIVFNTVHDPAGRLGRMIRVIHDNDGLVVADNLFSGPRMIIESPGEKLEIRDNLVKPVPDYFVDADRGNLHLTKSAVDAIGKAKPMKEVPADIDGVPRGDTPDLGAAQFAPEAGKN